MFWACPTVVVRGDGRAVQVERFGARMDIMTGGGDLSNLVAVADPGTHHDGSELHVPAQTPQRGDVVPVRIRVPSGTGVDSVFVCVVRDGEPMFIAATPDGGDEYENCFTAEVAVHNRPPAIAFCSIVSRPGHG